MRGQSRTGFLEGQVIILEVSDRHIFRATRVELCIARAETALELEGPTDQVTITTDVVETFEAIREAIRRGAAVYSIPQKSYIPNVLEVLLPEPPTELLIEQLPIQF